MDSESEIRLQSTTCKKNKAEAGRLMDWGINFFTVINLEMWIDSTNVFWKLLRSEPMQKYLDLEIVTNLDIADRISLLLFECNITQSKLYAANSISHPLIPSAYSVFNCDWHCKNKMTKGFRKTSGDHTAVELVFQVQLCANKAKYHTLKDNLRIPKKKKIYLRN